MDLFGPVTIQKLVRRRAMTAAMQRILVGTRTNLKSKIKESLGIVLLVARVCLDSQNIVMYFSYIFINLL